MDSVKILGVRIDKVTMKEAQKKCISFLHGDHCKSIYSPNPEIIMTAQEDKELFSALIEGDLVVPDGIGVIIVSKYLKLGLKERVTGIDLMSAILEQLNIMRGSVYLLGAKSEVVSLAAKNIKTSYPNLNICGYSDGYFSKEQEPFVIKSINEKVPDALFVALGSPRQELFIDKYKNILNTKLAMGVGGSFDVFAKVTKRAPMWMRKIGLEWFYRLCKEPTRIKRIAKIPKFFSKVISSKNSYV